MWERGWGRKRRGSGAIQTHENVKLCWYAGGIWISWSDIATRTLFYFFPSKVRMKKKKGGGQALKRKCGRKEESVWRGEGRQKIEFERKAGRKLWDKDNGCKANGRRLWRQRMGWGWGGGVLKETRERKWVTESWQNHQHIPDIMLFGSRSLCWNQRKLVAEHWPSSSLRTSLKGCMSVHVSANQVMVVFFKLRRSDQAKLQLMLTDCEGGVESGNALHGLNTWLVFEASSRWCCCYCCAAHLFSHACLKMLYLLWQLLQWNTWKDTQSQVVFSYSWLRVMSL